MKMEEEMKAEKSLEMEEKSLKIFRSKDKSQDAQKILESFQEKSPDGWKIGQSAKKSAPIQDKQSVTIDGELSSKPDICLFISISVTLFYSCKTIVNIINERESPLTSFTLHQSKYFIPWQHVNKHLTQFQHVLQLSRPLSIWCKANCIFNLKL